MTSITITQIYTPVMSNTGTLQDPRDPLPLKKETKARKIVA